jgi:putative transposase
VSDKRRCVEPESCGVSIVRQCELLGLPRSTYYYEPATESVENLELMRRLDAQYLETPFYGSRKMAEELSSAKQPLNRKRVQRLMRIMGLSAIYPRKSTSLPGVGHRVYPYLLRNLTVVRPLQVLCSDITYIPLRQGFMYLVAVMDWYSRYVLSWRLSNTLDTDFCRAAAEEAITTFGAPEIFNTDQGAQFTSHDFTSLLLENQIAISMDGRGRALDNVFIERLWRSLKYEDIYLKDYESGADLYCGLERYFDFYDHRRKHQALDYRTPHEAFTASVPTTHGRQTQRSKPRRPALS